MTLKMHCSLTNGLWCFCSLWYSNVGHKCNQKSQISTWHKHSTAPVNSPGGSVSAHQEQHSINNLWVWMQCKDTTLSYTFKLHLNYSGGCVCRCARAAMLFQQRKNRLALTGRCRAVVPMTEGWDEIEAAVHTVVLDVLAVQATLIPEVLLKLLVDVVGHGLPAGAENTHESFIPNSVQTSTRCARHG